jgi:hypothetical protein
MVEDDTVGVHCLLLRRHPERPERRRHLLMRLISQDRQNSEARRGTRDEVASVGGAIRPTAISFGYSITPHLQLFHGPFILEFWRARGQIPSPGDEMDGGVCGI